MKKILTSLSFVLLVGSAFSQEAEQQNRRTEGIPSYDYTVSLIKLIATPQEYHDRRIQVVGYLNLEFEGDAIYLHKEDYEQSILENSFWVSFSDKISQDELRKLNKRYVLIAGTFNMDNHGHMGLFSGEIMKIDRIIKWGK
ncbi:hypothetical protein [Reichenbachiella sp.]